jgi:hypothetical protein
MMTDMVLNTNSLQETLLHFIRTERVRLRETDGEIRLTPISETDDGYPLLGLLADYEDYTLDKFLARKHMDKELEP